MNRSTFQTGRRSAFFPFVMMLFFAHSAAFAGVRAVEHFIDHRFDMAGLIGACALIGASALLGCGVVFARRMFDE